MGRFVKSNMAYSVVFVAFALLNIYCEYASASGATWCCKEPLKEVSEVKKKKTVYDKIIVNWIDCPTTTKATPTDYSWLDILLGNGNSGSNNNKNSTQVPQKCPVYKEIPREVVYYELQQVSDTVTTTLPCPDDKLECCA